MVVIASVLTITALSLDRYIAINHPFLCRRLGGYHYPKIAVGLIWILAIIASSPLLMIQIMSTIDVIPGGEPLIFCQEIWPLEYSRWAYDIFLLLFIYVIPVTLMIILYTIMGTTLWSPGGDLRHQGSNSHKGNSQRQRRKVARVSAIVVLVFAVCWLPYHITSLTTHLKLIPDGVLLAALQFSMFLGHVNSAINPVLYCFTGQTFRKRVNKVMRAKYERKKVRIRQSNN